MGRLEERKINNTYKLKYNYVTNGRRTSMLIKDYINGEDKLTYKYDSLNNITHIYENDELINEYYYDEFNELIKEDDYRLNKTIEYIYDLEGNILKKKIFELKTNTLIEEKEYKYENNNWEDQLTSYDGTNISYDEIGNPTDIGNVKLTWKNGRELARLKDEDKNIDIEYEYNKDGVRTLKKINNNVKTEYYVEGSQIIFEKTGNNVIYYLRDSNSGLIGLEYNGTTYYYEKNAQDDVTKILDGEFNVVAKYEYDAWGNVISIKDNNGNNITDEAHIGNINPFRYRSYYYDQEIGMYYLNSRYYNPLWGRFINADRYLGVNNDILSYNLYSFASNNPISNYELNGEFWKKLVKTVSKAIKTVTKAVSSVCNFVKKEVKNTISEVKALVNVVKNNFVFEAEVGLGAEIDIGLGKDIGITIGGSKSVGYSSEKSSQYTSTNVGVEFNFENESFGLSADVRNYSDYGNPMEMPWEIWNEPTVEKDVTIGRNIDLGNGSAVIEPRFIGIEIGGYLFAGGKIKIGFNLGG